MKLQLPFGTVEPATWQALFEPSQRAYLTERLWSEPEILLEVRGVFPAVRPDVALLSMLGFDGEPLLERTVFATPQHTFPERFSIRCDHAVRALLDRPSEQTFEVLSGCAWTRLSPDQLPTTVRLGSDGKACIALIRYQRI